MTNENNREAKGKYLKSDFLVLPGKVSTFEETGFG
jgi:hypothetical protein